MHYQLHVRQCISLDRDPISKNGAVESPQWARAYASTFPSKPFLADLAIFPTFLNFIAGFNLASSEKDESHSELPKELFLDKSSIEDMILIGAGMHYAWQ